MTGRNWAGLGILTIAVLTAACSRDARLAGRNVRSVTVRAVTHYGLTLDASATPKQVAYVLLRAIRDDFLAPTPEEREGALDVQFDIAAAETIRSRNRTSLKPDEYLYHVVYRWTPTVSHYVDDFETDWETLEPRLVVRTPKEREKADGGPQECSVLMELDDPSGDSNARVVMIVWMARDNGLWRIVHLGFDASRRSIGN